MLPMQIWAKCVVLIFMLMGIHVFSQDKNYRIDTIQVKSKILQENRSILIYRPKNISAADSVKIIYLIDGEDSKYRYQKLRERFKDSIANLIAVGIVNTDRRRDLLYVNGADRFLDFIVSELIPVAEKDYKIKTRILFGHSFGGGFTIYSMIHKPRDFNFFIASSPTPIMDLVKKEDYLRIDSVSKRRIVFYFSYGSKDMDQVIKWADILKENLTGVRFKKLDWRFNIFEGKDHDNSDIAAFINGLKDLKE